MYFLLSRGLVWLVGTLAFLVIRPSTAANHYHNALRVDVGWPIDIWSNWDGGWYTAIAERGYQGASSTAFFPLYPYLIRGVSFLLGGHVVLASVLISLAACLVSFYLLHRLASDLAGAAVANRAVIYLAFFPTALFLQGAYAESLFLALALGTFVLAERGRLLAAGAVCGLALLTRPAALALVLALAVFVLRSRRWRHGAAALGLAFALFALYPLLLWAQHGDPFSFVGAQEHWGRHTSLSGPLISALGAVAMTVVFVAAFFVSMPTAQESLHWQRAGFNSTLALLALLAFIALLVAVYRRFGARSPYFIYSAASLAIPLFSPRDGNPLLSLPRFGLVIFPFFIALAMSDSSPRLHRVYVGASAVLLAIASASFALYGWVS